MGTPSAASGGTSPPRGRCHASGVRRETASLAPARQLAKNRLLPQNRLLGAAAIPSAPYRPAPGNAGTPFVERFSCPYEQVALLIYSVKFPNGASVSLPPRVLAPLGLAKTALWQNRASEPLLPSPHMKSWENPPKIPERPSGGTVPTSQVSLTSLTGQFLRSTRQVSRLPTPTDKPLPPPGGRVFPAGWSAKIPAGAPRGRPAPHNPVPNALGEYESSSLRQLTRSSFANAQFTRPAHYRRTRSAKPESWSLFLSSPVTDKIPNALCGGIFLSCGHT